MAFESDHFNDQSDATEESGPPTFDSDSIPELQPLVIMGQSQGYHPSLKREDSVPNLEAVSPTVSEFGDIMDVPDCDENIFWDLPDLQSLCSR